MTMTLVFRTVAFVAVTTLMACSTTPCSDAAAAAGTPAQATYDAAVRDCRWRHADRRMHVRIASNYDPAIAACLRGMGWTPGGRALPP